MSPFRRWWRFNLVGAMGMVLQLTALAVLNRVSGGRYLLASAVAIELTLVHNFLWHLHYTWRDRRSRAGVFAQLLRFHLSNGLVSMTGNFALMPVLVRAAHMPVVAANAAVILCCSLANFALGHTWAFAPAKPQTRRGAALSAAARLRCESPR